MGIFLALSGVIGKTHEQVVTSLAKYARTQQGGLEEANLVTDDDNCCVILESSGGTVVFYSAAFLEWGASSQFLSQDLNAPVFSIHLHDGDFWMYTLFNNGENVDQFNPIPEYWEEDLTRMDFDSWNGNAAVVASLIPGLQPEAIEKYLVRWDRNQEETKAYPDDEFPANEWQLVDFMKKVGLTYPVDETGKPLGKTYRFWTDTLPLQQDARDSWIQDLPDEGTEDKPWWKFW